jgi:hypothetical protein
MKSDNSGSFQLMFVGDDKTIDFTGDITSQGVIDYMDIKLRFVDNKLLEIFYNAGKIHLIDKIKLHYGHCPSVMMLLRMTIHVTANELFRIHLMFFHIWDSP